MDPILDPPSPEERADGPTPPDADVEPEDDQHVRPVDRWRHNTASGAVAAAFALGFQQVFDPERRGTVGIEQPAPTDPIDADGVELRFDPHSAAETVVVVRPPADE